MDLFILGNGFDLAHGMPTGYGDFKKWLVANHRKDVIEELQSAYPRKGDKDFLLWSEFEHALGEYDINTVINWSWENLFLSEVSLGNQLFNNNLIDTQLPDIINEAFTKWMRSIPMPTRPAFDFISSNAIYLTFNYTDTLEQLYHVPEQQILHIHGMASRREKLIVGHNRMIDPSVYWDDKLDVRENNERMQRLTDMNDLCKPVYEIIERNDDFFQGLCAVQDIHILGHSCDEIDYPYFEKVKESVSKGAKWHFNPYRKKDENNMAQLIDFVGIDYEQTTGIKPES